MYFLKTKNYQLKTSSGFLLIQVLVFATVASVLLGAMAHWGVVSFTATRRAVLREQAFHIAEAGVEYYRWHLAHAQNDFKDGTNVNGPYVHDYYDKAGTHMGQFSLTVTAPPLGGTTVVITSIGSVDEDTTISRRVEATLSIASFARYATLSNSSTYFGPGVQVYGEVHSNAGLRFDGIAHNIVYSSVDKYQDYSLPANSPEQLGVHTTIAPSDPAAPVSSIPPHADVFMAGREFPPFFNIAAVNFGELTATLADLKNKSLAGGFHLAKAGGSSPGYHIVLKTNGTFDLFKVTKLVSNSNCPSYNANGQPGWELGSIDTEELVSNYNYPDNGIIFVEDNLWLDGKVNTNRVTIAAGSFIDNGTGDPQQKNITINNNLLYTNYNGSDVIGVIAQNNINVGWASTNDLRIDAALIAKGGRVGRFYFAPPSGGKPKCQTTHVRNSIYLYGMIATNGRSGFTYTDGTGYQNRTIVYDSNLYYNPPPSFPLVSSQYTLLKWREIK